MRLGVSLPAFGVAATITLYERQAPAVCRAIYASLARPLETQTAHACFDGHAVYCYLRDFPDPPPVENSTMYPTPGDVMFYYAPPHAYAWMSQDQERMVPGGVDAAVHEFSFIYGPVNLTHLMGDSFYGSLIGRVTTGFDELTEAFARTLREGSTPVAICQDAVG